MKILHVTDTFEPSTGGIEVLVRGLADRQAAAGHEVAVLTRTPGLPDDPRDGGIGPVVVVRDPGRTAALVAEADAVHVHVSAYSPVALRAMEAAAHRGIPVVATVHSMWRGGWPVARAAASTRGWFDLPVQWSAVSEVAAGPVRKALAPRSVIVLPNAVDTAVWAGTPTLTAATGTDVAAGDAVTTRPGEHVVTVVAIMRMARRKRPLPLLAVLARARALVPDDVAIRCVLVGEGPQLTAVRRIVAGSRLASWVVVPGHLDHEALRALYRDADIFLAPSRFESFGIAALEARAAGLAVIGRSGTGLAEFVVDDVDGWLVGSDRQMAHRLARFCSDPVVRERLRTHNRSVPPVFDWADALGRADYAYRSAGLPALPRTPRMSG